MTATVRMGDLRAVIGPDARERNDLRAYRDLARDGVFYVLAVVGAVLLPSMALRFASGVVAGVAVTALFVWAHDAAHGALLGDTRQGRVLGTIAMLPSLQPFRLWQHGHNRVHHGFTSLVTIDWIWRPWDPADYEAASRAGRFGYRVERSLWGCGWHYLRRVWWEGMVRHRPSNADQRTNARFSWTVTGAWAVSAGGLAWWCGGPTAVLTAVVLPWLAFTYAIALITYLHHTHPTRRFFANRAEWDPVRGHVTGSTVLEAPRFLGWLFHDIFVHTPHHLDQRIPYYRLRAAWQQLRPAVGALDVLEYRMSSPAVAAVFRRCKLFDYASGSWTMFPPRRQE